MKRTAKIERKTDETEISLVIDLDGNGSAKVDTGIPFINHMLNLFSAHSFIDLELTARGDTDIDDHHTIEDIGICLGKAIEEALGDKKGIKRYGEATIPMDESLARVVIDISRRPVLSYRVQLKKETTGSFDVGLIKEFFRALVNNAGLTLHVDLIAGEEPHHVFEAIFKAFARALDKAISMESRMAGRIPSTKGIL
ncbi:MAG TPA: imidazoleglycerol-phosphate dehydratase HisB [Desulfobacteraceae bacterium]|nr:imidazoleglycerol-phosphate dehydratase HisB [Desulfobacteraceae bacterium]HPJ66858.1 imidazoleglycerol-phosphate dehydratase HisB [Desulfobacteraceae bacterium]HPQ28446.1 imidazoleglycerol-phosphate dehydratase HisB [Desulfobacteraceae bacterium]